MDSNTPGTPSPSQRPPSAAHHVVHIRSRPGGLWSAVAFVIGLVLFGVVFVAGLTLGVAGMFASSAMETVMIEQTYRSGSRDKIAILPIEGIISESQVEFARAAVDHILKDSNVKSVVLRVNSPGGGVTSSDQIWYEIERLKKSGMPVIASYGGIAASGGYYVSCGADHIMAEETSITGSIGVIAQLFTVHEMADKIGIEPVTLVATTSQQKDVGNNIFRKWDERDRQVWITILDQAHEIFLNRVSAGRSSVLTSMDEVMQVADGSIFGGAHAKQVGLVDAIGYLDDAILEAEQRGGISAGRAHVVRISAPPTFSDVLFGGASAINNLNANTLRSFINDLSTPRAMYLMY